MKAALIFSLFALSSASILQSAGNLSGWKVLGRAEPTKTVRVMFALKKDTSAAARHLKTVADPASSLFREWATKEASDRMVKVADATPVLAHLRAHGVVAKLDGDTVVADMTIAQVEASLGTVVDMYQNDVTGRQWHRAANLHAPEDVARVVSSVFGLHGMPLPPKTSHVHGKNGVPEAMVPVGPTQIRQTYQVTGRGSGNVKVRQAVAEFQGQFSNIPDIQSFFQQFVPNAQPGDDTVYAYKGNQGSGYGVEALLDIQYIMGNAPGVKTEFWGWANFDFCADLKNWTQTILADTNPPLVFSISYGWQGDLSQIGCTNEEVQDVDHDFMLIAGRGISVIFASGDSGSSQTGNLLWPSWPASSPFVTSVGATCFTDQSMSTEMASTQFGSGSGFSSMFDMPSWQADAVTNYLKAQTRNLPPASYWKLRNGQPGRATADVSALGEGYQVVINGGTYLVGGTSASTPTFSSIISLANDKLIRAGKKQLGYLNPFLYSNASLSFKDITMGSDKIARDGTTFQYGFDCTTGWDPATGFGSPLFTKLSP